MDEPPPFDREFWLGILYAVLTGVVLAVGTGVALYYLYR